MGVYRVVLCKVGALCVYRVVLCRVGALCVCTLCIG